MPTIVPLKASSASEKFEEFGNKGVKVGIATGDFDRRDDLLEKMISLLPRARKSIPFSEIMHRGYQK